MNILKGLFMTMMVLIGAIMCTSCVKNEDYQASLRMINKTFQKDSMDRVRQGGYVAAYYYGKQDYYCVSTYKKSEKEIADLRTHEQCHALIKSSQYHFCGEYT